MKCETVLGNAVLLPGVILVLIEELLSLVVEVLTVIVHLVSRNFFLGLVEELLRTLREYLGELVEHFLAGNDFYN